MKTNKTKHIIGSVTRSLLALTFLFSGAVKAIDPLGTVYKIEDYLKAFGGFMVDLIPMAEVAAIALISVELVLGICLLLNVRTRLMSVLTLIFFLVMTPLTLYIALTNPVSDCGCFGDALILTNWQTFGKNVILLTLAIILMAMRKDIPSTFVGWMELVIAIVALGAGIGFMEWTWHHLPVVDFRPYKVGNYLPALMEIPEGAETDEYEITFVYAKDGVEKTFTLEDYPAGDSTWTFVRQNSKLLKKGYEPPIHDFEIVTSDFEDITFDILESEEPVTLVIMYDLDKTDRKLMNKVNALYEECAMQGKAFYALTGSGTDDVLAFQMETGAKYPWCSCDPVTLKTIVRANPGVVVLQNGYVMDKWNVRNR